MDYPLYHVAHVFFWGGGEVVKTETVSILYTTEKLLYKYLLFTTCSMGSLAKFYSRPYVYSFQMILHFRVFFAHRYAHHQFNAD